MAQKKQAAGEDEMSRSVTTVAEMTVAEMTVAEMTVAVNAVTESKGQHQEMKKVSRLFIRDVIR